MKAEAKMGRQTKTSGMTRQNNDAAALAAEEILNEVVEAPKTGRLNVTRDVLVEANNTDDTFVQDTLRTLREKLKE